MSPLKRLPHGGKTQRRQRAQSIENWKHKSRLTTKGTLGRHERPGDANWAPRATAELQEETAAPGTKSQERRTKETARRHVYGILVDTHTHPLAIDLKRRHTATVNDPKQKQLNPGNITRITCGATRKPVQINDNYSNWQIRKQSMHFDPATCKLFCYKKQLVATHAAVAGDSWPVHSSQWQTWLSWGKGVTRAWHFLLLFTSHLFQLSDCNLTLAI